MDTFKEENTSPSVNNESLSKERIKAAYNRKKARESKEELKKKQQDLEKEYEEVKTLWNERRPLVELLELYKLHMGKAYLDKE